MTVMVINKQLTAGANVALNLTNFQSGSAVQVWQLNSSNAITRLGNLVLSGTTLAASVPPQSITLFILPAAAVSLPLQLSAGSFRGSTNFDLWLSGQPGQTYVLQSTTDFANWASVQTNTLSSNSWHVVLPAVRGPAQFYRARQN